MSGGIFPRLYRLKVGLPAFGMRLFGFAVPFFALGFRRGSLAVGSVDWGLEDCVRQSGKGVELVVLQGNVAGRLVVTAKSIVGDSAGDTKIQYK